MSSSNIPLLILQLNCNGAAGVMADLGQFMLQKGIHVALCQEPYFAYSAVRGLPSSLSVFHSPSKDACIVVNTSHGIQAMQISAVGMDSAAVVHCKGWFGEVIFLSMYFVYRRDIEEFLPTLQMVVRKHNEKPLIIGVDANATSPLWYSKRWKVSTRSAERGRLLEDAILEESLIVLNEPSEAFTFNGPRGVSDIDVTVCNERFSNEFRSTWSVLEGLGISDHQPLMIQATRRCADEPVAPSQLRWRSKRADWKEYERQIRCLVEVRNTTADALTIDQEVDALTQKIHSVNDELMLRHQPVRRKSTCWWNDELASQRAEVKHKRRLAQRARRRDDGSEMEFLREYRSSRLRYKRALHKAKEEEFRSFVATEGNDHPWGEVYKLCMGKKRWHNLCSIKIGDSYTSSWADTVDVLTESFFPVAEAHVDEQREDHEEVPNPTAFGPEEIAESVHRNSSGKAPGMDGITSKMMRCIWKAIPDTIVALFNRCLTEGVFPTRWKEASLVILKKSPDKNPTDVRSYRPICLLSVLGKTLERLMVLRLLLYESYTKSGAQYGFTSGRSTEDAWLDLQAFVQGSEAKYILAVSVDFRGAFDNLLWTSVLRKLKGLDVKEYRLWKSYFQDRRICVVGNAETRWRDVRRGCPQGSICGPAIWNVMMEDLLSRLISLGCKTIAYADDLLLVIEGSSRMELEQKGNEWFSIVNEWGLTVGVEVNLTKTTQTLLRGSFDRERMPSIKTGTGKLATVKVLKYLGVSATIGQKWTRGQLVQSRFMYQEHLALMRQKLAKVVFPLKRVMRKEWGLRIRATRTIYLGLMVPCVAFAAVVWSDCLRYANARDSLQSMQRIALMACVKICRTVSTDAIQVLLGELPWDLEIGRRSTICRIRKGLPLTDLDCITQDECTGRSEREISRLVEDKLFDQWQARWEESTRGRVTFSWIPQVRFAKSHPDFEPSLQLGYLLTGHGSFNAFLHDRGLAVSPACGCGFQTEDWLHVTTACPLYADIRDLSAMGIHERADGTFDFSHALASRETYQHLGVFAHEVFARKKAAATPVDD